MHFADYQQKAKWIAKYPACIWPDKAVNLGEEQE